LGGTQGETRGGRGGGLTIAEICAVSYVLILDELERLAMAFIQAQLFARALAGSGEVPSWTDIRAAFDAALMAPPEKVADVKDHAMLTAIGLREAS
jgi:hypothetical protein